MEQLDAVALRGMVAAGESALAHNVEAVNALNVFPVPDGDTGTNMLLTLRAVGEELAKSDASDLAGVAASGARGALLGARGNSGVILSQFFAGLGRSFRDVSEADTPHVAQAFQNGADAAYKAVSNPTEGTILTVMRATAEAMQAEISDGDGDLVALLERGLEACRVAVLRTPEQLPVLREAGVVDAGGQGFALVLEGALSHLRGDDVGAISLETVLPVIAVREDFLNATESMEYGYCTQVLIRGEELDPDDIRVRVSAMADSTVVVGDDTLVQVHAHTLDPGPILSLGAALGTLGQVKVENIDEQHVEFQAAHRGERKKLALAIVAVAWGDGLEELFRSLGAHAIVAGGQTMNPSCQQLLDAVEALGAEETVLLPNNSNVVLTAHQAADLSPTPLRVVPSSTIPQGSAAMVAFNVQSDLEENVEAMSGALDEVRSGEVVTAVRDAQVDGQAVREGEVMASLDGVLVATGGSCAEVLEALVAGAEPSEGSLVTLYWGGDTEEAEAEECVPRLQERFPGVEVEVVKGGQPFYHYLVSIE